MKFEPHPYQRYAIDRIIDGANVGLFMDMGLGKTVVTLTAIDQLIHDWGFVRRVLVIAPKKVAEATWQSEAAKWDHLSRLTLATALGTAQERATAIDSGADVTIINRENVVWLVENWSMCWPFDMVVVDESSSFKNPASKRFKALRRMLPKIRDMVILTGTPAPNGIEDLWSQIYLLDRGERLGRYITHYRARYFDHNPWRHEYIPKPGAFEAVRRKISDICVSMSAEDYLQLPGMVIHGMPVELDAPARKAYRQLERTFVLEVDGTELSAMSAAALTGKLLQLCGGCVYDENGAPHRVHTAKLEALGELLEAINEPVLLFYGFRHELPYLRDQLTGRRWRELSTAADADAWNRGEVDVLLAHPASCAYGLNLQAGGRHVVWYTLTWSLELYQQANARLYRQGQTKPVIVHRLLVKGGVDEDVAKALEGKDETQAALIKALKARIMEART
ncbi:MAG: DEAD/DEAH box helicase [Clostridia bacterium]|nr:DEAD/DEAH box helicase [Clostridia bacterium]